MQIRSCAVLGLMLGWAQLSPCDILYSVADLGTLGGYYSTASGINNSGQVTGTSTTDGGFPYHAFLYSNGQMLDLGTLGGSSSYGTGANDKGQVTGNSDGIAFLYTNGRMSELDGKSSYGLGINNSGQVTGYSFTSTPAEHASYTAMARCWTWAPWEVAPVMERGSTTAGR
jgi:probable HAF family extracellular repeat protein